MVSAIGCGEGCQHNVDYCDHENSHHQNIIRSLVALTLDPLEASLGVSYICIRKG